MLSHLQMMVSIPASSRWSSTGHQIGLPRDRLPIAATISKLFGTDWSVCASCPRTMKSVKQTHPSQTPRSEDQLNHNRLSAAEADSALADAVNLACSEQDCHVTTNEFEPYSADIDSNRNHTSNPSS